MSSEFRNTTRGVSRKAAYLYVPKTSKIPGLRATASVADPIVHVKLFDPTGSWTWYLTEADRETGTAFGLVDGHEAELGYVDLHELSAVRVRFGLPIERDIHWTPTPLSEVRAKYLRGRG